jgi:gamma-glutamyl:cysteine ligase YbdK (ATP-grasp superfamily)
MKLQELVENNQLVLRPWKATFEVIRDGDYEKKLMRVFAKNERDAKALVRKETRRWKEHIISLEVVPDLEFEKDDK